jgi:hypothetical protein
MVVVAVIFLLAVSIPIILALAGAMTFAMPWLFFGLAAWLMLSPKHHHARRRGAATCWPNNYRQAQSRWQRLEWRPVGSAPARQISAAGGWAQRVDQPAPAMNARPELPIDVQLKVEQIRRKSEVLLGLSSRFPPYSKDLYLVRQTASEYLPRTVDTYLALPAVDGERLLPTTGKPALQELHEQLDLLDGKLDEIAANLQARDFDRFVANRRFLEDRFGSKNA